MTLTVRLDNTLESALERYCTEDPQDHRALWLETRLKFNNTRHVAMRPGGAL